MSACLSVTIITSVETMLNAATATISGRMMNIIRFSICTARKKLAWSARPVAHLGALGLEARELARDRRRG